MEVNKTIRAKHYGGRRTSTMAIVMHYTANDGMTATAKGNANYFHNTEKEASAHFVIDEAECYECVPPELTAFAVGGGKYASCNVTGGGRYYGIVTNKNSISVEMVSHSGKDGFFIPRKTLENAAEFIRELKRKYPDAMIIRHFDVTGKACPATHCITPQGEERWKEFLSMTEEDKPMTTEEKKKFNELVNAVEQIRKELEEIKKNQERVYHYTEELPEYARPVIQRLIDKKYYFGVSESDLDLPESLMRTLVINERAGLYI